MLKRSLRNRSLHGPAVTDHDVGTAVDGLLRGESHQELPADLCHASVTTLTHMRKDAILHHKDSLANKIDEVIGEVQRGPARYQCDSPEDPERARRGRLATRKSLPDRLHQTGAALVQGARVDGIDPRTRQSVEPLLKTRRVLEVSRAHYPASQNIDAAIDGCIEYEIDSRRLAPRLLKIQALECRLADARAAYDDARMRARNRRQQFEAIHDATESDLEDKLKNDMLLFGSHVPTTLPLEYSKFSNRVLDARAREQKSAHFRFYDDAQALRGEVVRRERDELDTLSERFSRSFKLQRQTMLSRQDQQRLTFQDFWTRKKEKVEAETTAELIKLRKAVDHLQLELNEARRSAGDELARIRTNERRASTPITGKVRGNLRAIFQ
jgi:hypothetical protein